MSRTLSTRVDDELGDALEAVLPDDVSQSEALRRALREFIDEADPTALAADDLAHLPMAARKGYETLLRLTNGGGEIWKKSADTELAEATKRSKSKGNSKGGFARSPLETAVLNPLQNAGLLRVVPRSDHVVYVVYPIAA
ncbi:MAG: hypothetical protein ABEI57_07285, partial [Halapricum sp.]